jgi:hypothetical protein
MTSSRLSLEKKTPANAPQPPARDSVEWANLRKDRYQPERCGYRLASRRPSRNSHIRHLILGATVSTRSRTNNLIDLRSRLHFRPRLQKHCLHPLESITM